MRSIWAIPLDRLGMQLPLWSDAVAFIPISRDPPRILREAAIAADELGLLATLQLQINHSFGVAMPRTSVWQTACDRSRQSKQEEVRNRRNESQAGMPPPERASRLQQRVRGSSIVGPTTWSNEPMLQMMSFWARREADQPRR